MANLIAAHSITLKLALSLLLGLLIGVERQYKQRHTGLVTHALVALGAASYASLPGALGLELDLRMGSQVVTGIGFLGAGLIMRDGTSIRGLSTAATVWSTGAVGVFVGYGFLLLAVETTLFVILSNVLLPRLALYVGGYSSLPADNEKIYFIKIQCDLQKADIIRSSIVQAIELKNLRLMSMDSDVDEGKDISEIRVSVLSEKGEERSIDALIGFLAMKEIVHFVGREADI
ncbi:MgtC/SapB family protein [Mesorhizobium sp. AR07]|nr:MgtC/SapB family protein [Mesorhizobium sp. AR07]